jgi:hypothetical protein
MSSSRGHGPGGVVGVQRRQQQPADQGGPHGDVGRLPVADLATMMMSGSWRSSARNPLANSIHGR